ncbi:uncharacterized protein UTRI_02119_B [Ustilago trichophora]|uniref:Ysc84 actin-binding domain-containing protein n=1 Tax=Ustilago trichophora TaxID=86804 RepID=A0A5C3DUG7_9BASI|nr:uncharacterized protein UTRI_02119_B [Ustilago trichophora]
MSAPPPPPTRTVAAASSSTSTSTDAEQSRWKRWGKTAFDKSIVVSDWASGYANSASAKMGGERFWPKSNDFPEEIAKCERILRAFTAEGIEAKPAASSTSGSSTPPSEGKDEATDDAETATKPKESFMKKKRKVLRKIPPAVIKRAKGIIIYTAMRSGIAPFGGAGGAGLMLARLPDGSWSAPSSITPNNLAVGLLLGFDIFDVILVVNTDRAMQSFKSHKVTLGAETAVAAGPFGTGISGEMGIDRSPVFSYVRSRGLYGGVEAMAQAFLHRFDENERIYYWPGITAADILEGRVRKPPLVDPLYRALRDAETGVAQGDSLERTVYEPIHAPPNIAVRQLQQEESAELLQDGERLKLPPTPEELEAMEEAGIPDEFDLELEKKEAEEARIRAEQEKREIMALPPPPKHKNVVGYWEKRGSTVGRKRRVAPPPPSPLNKEAEVEGKEEQQAEAELELIDLNEPEKPPLPVRRPQQVESLADELGRTSLEDNFEEATEVDLPAYQADSSSATAAAADGDHKAEQLSNSSPPLPAGALDKSSEAVPLIVTEPIHDSASSTDPKPALPADLTSDSLSRSTSLTRPSRPPRRAPRGNATPTTPTTPSSPTFTTTTTKPSLRLFFDWDETITSSDTLSLIAPPESHQLHGPSFSHYTSAYLSDLSEFETSFGPREDWQTQLKFLERIDEVELASVARVEEGGLFKGVTLSSIRERAETEVQFREGWEAFNSWLSAEVKEGKLSADVISVGWSGEFIRHALSTQSSSSERIPKVYANEIEMDPNNSDDVATGKITKSLPLSLLTLQQETAQGRGGIRTGLHKLTVMQALSDSSGEGVKRVYVGDSTTDLPCLVAADFGLVMKARDQWEDSSVRKVIEGTKPPVKRLYEEYEEFLKADADEKEQEGEGGVLVRVDDWTQALEVIKKIQERMTPASL